MEVTRRRVTFEPHDHLIIDLAEGAGSVEQFDFKALVGAANIHDLPVAAPTVGNRNGPFGRLTQLNLAKHHAAGREQYVRANDAPYRQLHFGIERFVDNHRQGRAASAGKGPRIEDGPDGALFPRLEHLLGDVRFGTAATAPHSGDVDILHKDILELEVVLGLRALRDCPKVVLGRLEHLAGPRLGLGRRCGEHNDQPGDTAVSGTPRAPFRTASFGVAKSNSFRSANGWRPIVSDRVSPTVEPNSFSRFHSAPILNRRTVFYHIPAEACNSMCRTRTLVAFRVRRVSRMGGCTRNIRRPRLVSSRENRSVGTSGPPENRHRVPWPGQLGDRIGRSLELAEPVGDRSGAATGARIPKFA